MPKRLSKMNSISSAKQQLQHNLLLNTLARIFGQVDEAVFEVIEKSVVWREVSGGEVLFKQGDVATCLYGVLSGRLRAFVTNESGDDKILGDISQGQTVGEMSIFTGERRSASVVAIRDSVLVEVSKEAFEDIIRASPLLVMNITKLIIERLNRQNAAAKVVNNVVNVAVVGLHHPDLTKTVVHNLSKTLATKGTVRLLNPSIIAEVFHDDSLAFASKEQATQYRSLSNWLDEQESVHRFVLYEATDLNSEWAMRCIRQADEVLFVADASQSAFPTLAEQQLISQQGRVSTASQTLLLVRPEGDSIPRQTHQWLEPRRISQHFHLCISQASDYHKIVRYLTSSLSGLVLAGGGAKGFAHLGVYRALTEAGIPIDMVGGTSMGAIVSALIALDHSPSELTKIMRGIYVEGKNPTKDFNYLPIVSLLKGKKVSEILRTHFGEHDIEDTLRTYFCVSSNLTKTQAVVHTRGSMSHAIRASISLPGVFPPVVDKEGLLVDGALFNNMPVDEMIRLGAGKIIASDLNIKRVHRDEISPETNPWKLLWTKLFQKEKQTGMPGLMSIIFQSSTLSSDFKTVQFKSLADIYFNPDVMKYGMMDWNSFDKIVEVGYQHATKVLEGHSAAALFDSPQA
jgi:predicted acylesterase/phospholipase RssA/CRP-like cAMP-binding protein